jgi:hypothetical protein
MKSIVIAFPVLQIKLFGLPDFVRLTAKEADAMRLYHLGGFGAWRTETAKVACRTIDSLIRKGFFETVQECTDAHGTARKSNATILGKCVAEGCAEQSQPCA